MIYEINIKKSALKEYEKLEDKIKNKIKNKILTLKETPRPHKLIKLVGIEAYRIRIGDYRLVYTIDDVNKTIEIMAIGHRKDIYGK